MVTLRDHAGPSLAATVTRTEPPPRTEVESTVIHWPGDTLNVHADDPPAVAVCVPPPAVNSIDPDDQLAAQPSACVICTFTPPIVTVPVRRGLSFGSTVTLTESPPDTDVEPTEIQLRLSLTSHLQAEWLVAVTLNELPPLVMSSDVVDSDSSQTTPLWFTVNDVSPTYMVPERRLVLSFSVTEYDTVSDAQLSIVIQLLDDVLGLADVRQYSSVQASKQMAPGFGGVYVHVTVNEPDPASYVKFLLSEDSS